VQKWSCNECGSIVMDRDLVSIAVTHPKTKEPVPVSQCPECGDVNCFKLISDEPGCGREATSGWPSPQGYRHTCYNHHAN
jgi:hypothetical protein